MSKNKTPQTAQQWVLLGGAITIASVLLVVPLVFIFVTALSGGWELLQANLQKDYMQHALGLTLLVAVLTVPLNTLFGILFAWLVTHYEFLGGRLLLRFISITIASVLLVVPLVFIFVTALSGGWELLQANLQKDYMQHALGLTLLVAVLTVPLNTLFGILFAWLVTHYEFRGRRLLLTFIDI